MRRVKFITGLKIEDRTLYDGQELRYATMSAMPQNLAFLDKNAAIDIETTVEYRVVPVQHLRQYTPGGPSDTFIAHSPEVENLLKMPFEAMQQHIKEQQGEIQRLMPFWNWVRRAGFWQRLRFLFTGNCV